MWVRRPISAGASGDSDEPVHPPDRGRRHLARVSPHRPRWISARPGSQWRGAASPWPPTSTEPGIRSRSLTVQPGGEVARSLVHPLLLAPSSLFLRGSTAPTPRAAVLGLALDVGDRRRAEQARSRLRALRPGSMRMDSIGRTGSGSSSSVPEGAAHRVRRSRVATPR
jgi:hypothetical protein